MLCPKCGYYTDKEENVCPECGEILSTYQDEPLGGAEAIRQGKRARQAIHDAAARQTIEARRRRRSGASHATVEMPAVRDEREGDYYPDYTVSEEEIAGEDESEETVFERRRRTVYDENSALEEQAKAYTQWIKENSRHKLKMVNWIKITVIILTVVILAAAGVYVFVNETDEGQKIMARMGRKATSSALWAVGEELMNTGDIEGAIQAFEKAREQDKADEHVDVDGQLMLGSAYEAAGRTDDAAALYEQIYTDTPSRTEAYVNHIRILLSSGNQKDKAAAGDLMKKAYEQTGESSFQTQRSDLIPAPPEPSKVAGFYERKISLSITSYQGYEVYYTFDENAELPSGGTLFTDALILDERTDGDTTWNLRAVAVNGELVSDELKASYKIIMPSPQMPQCNLAPGTYKTRQRVKLKPGKDNQGDDDIKIYYSVDGSDPSNGDCPLYTGEPVLLPSGHTVTLKAVAVNQYNKISTMLEVNYKIEAKPYPQKAWDLTETIAGLELNKTTMLDFQSAYGEGKQGETDAGQSKGFTTELRKYEYPWGYAVMNMTKRTWVLVELYFRDDTTFKAPRETGVGDPLDYVVSKFKDLGQLESAKGNRSLYALDSGSDGKIKLQNAATGEKIIQYRVRSEGHWYQLSYYVNPEGTVTAVDYRYIPQ